MSIISPTMGKTPGKTQHRLRGDGRMDLKVHSDATALVVTSHNVGGYEATALYSPKNWAKAVEKGVFIPMELALDDDFLLRVVVGELRDAEASDWVGRLSWKLSLPEGQLVLASGIEYLIEEDKEAEFLHELTNLIEVPPGDYRFDIYSYLVGVHGEWDLPEGDKEPLGAYFRRTRAEEAMPDWLKSRLARSPRLDPGHESYWQQDDVQMERVESWENEPPPVDFVVQLRPLTAESGVPAVMPELNDSLFRMQERRRPELFPLGVSPVDLATDPG